MSPRAVYQFLHKRVRKGEWLNVAIVVPTLNAANDWHRLAPALLTCISPEQVLIVDSSSTDGTADLARSAGFRVKSVTRASFNHGGTRQLAAELLEEAEILVYLTQDAVLATSDAIDTLLEVFADPAVAAAYGRQLPRPGANGIEVHARLFNYPSESGIRGIGSRDELGIKAAFISNSFAAYRRSQLIAFGGFPRDSILAEDMVIAARLLLGGLKIAYVAEAQVYHSHAYTWSQDFRRYFDTGVLHTRECWLLNEFGQVNGEGKRFVVSELKHLWREEPWLIPSAIVRTALKLLGYRLGRLEQRLSVNWKRRLSMHHQFWK